MAKKVSKTKKSIPTNKATKTKTTISLRDKKEIELEKKKKSIITAFDRHFTNNSIIGIVYSNWYVGITKHANAKIRITRHMKDKKTLALFPIVRNAITKDNANAVESAFSKKGTINSPNKGGAKIESIYVYAFKNTPTIIDIIKDLMS